MKVSWDDSSQYIESHKTCSKPPTSNMSIIFPGFQCVYLFCGCCTYVSFACAKQMHVPVHIEVLHVSQETPKDSGLNMSCEVHHAIPTVAIRRNTNDLEPDCKPYRTIRVGGSFPRLHDIKTADFFFVVEGTNVSV